MSMKPGFHLKLSQKPTMTPRLQQAIKFLQMSAPELQTELQKFLEANCFLERIEDDTQASSLERFSEVALSAPGHLSTEVTTSEVSDPITTLEPIAPESDAYPEHAPTAGGDWQFGTERSLREHLNWQRELSHFKPDEHQIAISIIDAINEDGYLEQSLEELAQSLSPITPDAIEQVLYKVQQFEPVGIAARTVGESLSLQVRALEQAIPHRAAVLQLIDAHLDLLAKKQYTRLKACLGLNDEALQAVIQVLQSLHPRPGTAFYQGRFEYVTPDVVVYKEQDVWQLVLNRECSPKVRINPHYAALVRRADDSQTNLLLKEQLLEARWLMKSLQNRQDTLLTVAQSIIELQGEFLEHGETAFKPLILSDVAARTGLHESTISRITTQKYLATPRGVFELKFFFSSQVLQTTGQEVSSKAIQAMIKKLIAEEISHKPLSDQKIALELERAGYRVARRTVTKYRVALSIPPSHERKEWQIVKK